MTLVHYDDTPGPTGGEYLIVWSDAPDHASELADDDPRWGVMCLDCLLDEGPELGRALEIAREHGSAERDPDTGDWRPGDNE